MPLRIAYVVGSLSPGGSERQMLALAERLPADRFSVEFVLLSGRGPYAARAELAGARVRAISGSLRAGGSLNVVSASAAALRFTAIVRSGHYDIVDAWLYRSYVLAALTRPLTRVPVLVAGRRSLHDHKEAFGRLERAADAVARRWSDVIVANSNTVAADVILREGVDPTQLRVIRNGVEPSRGMSEAPRRAARQRWGLTGAELVIGCVANYRPGKGHLLLLDAFAALASDRPMLRLVLVGEGELRPVLERRIREFGLEGRAFLHGAALDPQSLMRAFDIVVQASESEGLPNAILEAAADGRPIVATAAGGTVEIVDHHRTGILVPVNDMAALSRGVQVLIGDAGLRERLGAAAQEHVLHTFGMERFVSEFATLYEEMAARKGMVP